ncbi:TRAP transporter small permease subunit [Humitalea sp. 24SJ18S-53]|uniref:TRAP transporter small permease subunit n=1 Tax=Humitalea sp. 24SJ18S-53 TaxID=3422307 RepID=UPI003D6742EE
MAQTYLALRIATGLRRLLERIGGWMGVAAGWIYVGIAIFVTADVLSRRFLGTSSGGTTEVSGYMMGFGIAWGVAQAMTDRAHVRIDVLVMRLPLAARQLLHVFSLALLTLLMIVVAWSSIGVVEESILFDTRDISALAVPLVVPQSLWAFGLCFFALLLVAMLLESLCLLIAGRGAEVDAMLRPRSYEEETQETLIALSKVEGTP